MGKKGEIGLGRGNIQSMLCRSLIISHFHREMETILNPLPLSFSLKRLRGKGSVASKIITD